MTEPSRAITRYDGPRTVDELERYSLALAVNSTTDRQWRNDALPATFRGNPAAVAFAVEYAKALDVSPVTAIIGIHIVDGKPTASAGLISALVRRAGHQIRTWFEGSFDDGTGKGITTITRADDPDFEYRSVWTIERAIRANLLKRSADGRVIAAKERSAWSTYPENMLKARSLTECARDAAEDAVLGVHYTPEELGVDVDETGEPVHVVTSVPSTTTRVPAENDTRGDETGEANGSRPAPSTPPPTSPEPPTGTPSTETSSPSTGSEASPAGESPSPAAGDDAAPLEYDPVDADGFRVEILKARDLDQLGAVWTSHDLKVARCEATLVGSETGLATDLLALFKAQTAAIRAGNPLVDLYGGDDEPDGGQGATNPTPSDSPPAGDAATPENASHGDVSTEVARNLTVEDGGPVARALVDLLDGIRRENPDAFDTVVAWARENHLNPYADEEQAGAILEAVQNGNALPVSYPAPPEEPLDLLVRVLGATVLEVEELVGAAQMHSRQLDLRRAAEAEENRRDAADAGRRGPAPVPPGEGFDAYAAARASRGAPPADRS